MEKLKILYAAGHNSNAKIALLRFLNAIQNKPYTIKVAAFKNSSPKGYSIDWTLDCLLNMFNPKYVSFEDNFKIYFDQVKYYAPDLIISDMEHFTSRIANELNITLWQCSSSLINPATTFQERYNLGIHKDYSFLLKTDGAVNQQIAKLINNSNLNLVYSHLGDMIHPPSLKENFEWIRPYHTIGKESIPCRHNLVAGMLHNNKKILSFLKKYKDSVAFTEFYHENYNNIYLKNINNQEEYFCNLKNSNLFICEGQTSFLADAFYNGKYSIVITNFKDTECVINSMFSKRFGLSNSIYDLTEKLNDDILNYQIKSNYNNIKYLHQWIDDLF